MRSAYVKLIPNHTLEPHPPCLWPVEHARVRHLELAERQLVDITGSPVCLCERGRQTANPSPEETLDRTRAQSITDFLQSRRRIGIHCPVLHSRPWLSLTAAWP